MSALGIPLAGIAMGAFGHRSLRGTPTRFKTYCCRYCGLEGLQWQWHQRISAWRLMTPDFKRLHDCPHFTPRRRHQFVQECKLLGLPRRTVVKIRAKKRTCKCR